MIKKSKSQTLFAVILSVLAIPLAGGIADAQTMLVSIPSLHLVGKERVVGFKIQIKSGRIAAAPNVPIGWHVTIDNDASWRTSIEGTVEVGAAALDSTFFQEFLVVEKNESMGIPFEIKGEVDVSEDFEALRRIKISMKDLVMKNVAARNQ